MGLSPVLLSKLAVSKPIGLCVGDREVTVCRAALTPLGPVELSSESAPYDGLAGLPEVFEQLLRPYLSRRGSSRVRVALGLPAMRVFFSTRPIQGTDRDASATVLLHEVLRSSDVDVEDMEIDVVRGQPGKRPLASLVACRREFVTELLKALTSCGVRPYRAEPAPFALLRLGACRVRAPRKAAAVIRFFLGPAEGLAMLLQAGMPLAWRTFELPPGGETSAVLSMARALQVVSRHCGETGFPDAVLIHGRADLGEALRDETFTEALGCRPQHVAEPSYDGRSIALGLAMGCREAVEGVDLSRTIKARPPVWEVIPFGQIAAQAAVLAGCSWLLGGHLDEVRRAYNAAHAECTGHTWIKKVKDDAMAKEKSDLEAKVATVKGFLETRIAWSTFTRDTAARLTESMVLRTFNGNCDFSDKGGATTKKSLVLNVTAPIPQGQSMPPEIDTYLNVLRSDETLRHDFPHVELGGLMWSQSGGASGLSQASFSVNCLPKAEKAGGKAAKKPAGKGE